MPTRPTAFPFWGRVLLLAGIVGLVAGGGLLAYRLFERPTTLTLAIGSLDGGASKSAEIIASRFAKKTSPILLTVEKTGSLVDAAQAFAAGKADLAAVRADVGDLADARSVVVLDKGVVMLMALPDSHLATMEGLRGHTVGVVGGDVNRRLVGALTRQYDLARADVTFKDIAEADVRRAVEARDVAALLIVAPLTDKYLSYLRSLFKGAMPTLIPIDSAGAIADADGAYESYDIPKGTLRGAPAAPADDVTTLRVGYYLVANKKLPASLVARLTERIIAVRRNLVAERPQLAGIAAADTDPDAYIPVHLGAAEYYNGTEQSFMDRYGDDIYLAPMIFGALASLLAAAWRFLGLRLPDQREATLDALTALPRRIRRAVDPAALDALEEEADAMIGGQLALALRGDAGALDVPTLVSAAQRLDNLIHHRRLAVAREFAPGPG
ncbi:MAG: TAXI family TRAP transporter solute-binding subunit [Tardiphaga sp.]